MGRGRGAPGSPWRRGLAGAFCGALAGPCALTLPPAPPPEAGAALGRLRPGAVPAVPPWR